MIRSKPGLTVVALLLFVCPVMTATQDEQAVPFETIVNYGVNGPREKLQTVVFKRRDWKRLWSWAHSGFASVPPLPEVDFSQRMIIAFSPEYLPDPSWSLAITTVVRTEQRLTVFVRETQRGGRLCPPVPDVLVHPLVVIEAERVEKKLMKTPEFDIKRIVVDCEPAN